MVARVTVIAGPPSSGKTERGLRRYRESLAENVPGSALWIAPSWRAAAELRARLLAAGCEACFSPAVMTFEGFAETVLEVAPVAIRPMSRLMKRQLVRGLIDDQLSGGHLSHFRPIADTGGLVDLLCEFIGELKRLEIWPEHFRDACQARGMTDKDRELLAIYQQYQRVLTEHHLYDAEGRFWSARNLLKQGQQRPWERLRLVVADGFTDFTRTQHEILQILARPAEDLLITLPLEPQPIRADLFAKPLATLSELRRRHPNVVIEERPRPAQAGWPAMAHLEATLFTNPRHAQPAESTAAVEILAAAQPSGEIESIGSRIKRLLAQGDARPGEIAVVFRSPETVGPWVSEVFGALGIPFSLEAGQPLDRSPALRALVTLLRLDAEDWTFRSLLAVLRSNYLQPDWPCWAEGKTALAAERIIRRLQISRGRQRLLGRLDTLPDDPAASVVLAFFQNLAAAFDELPQRATIAAWAHAWERLARHTGLFRAIEEQPSGDRPLGLGDQAAWTRLMHALGVEDQLARWLVQRPAERDRHAALAGLLDVLASERIGPSGDDSGRVRVLSAASVRALRVPYLFLAGLSERSFPAADREDRLYSEAESQRLIDEGLPLVPRTERSCAEMLLFYEAMTRATRRLYLSYPALDASAQPLSPSPYIREVEQACAPLPIPRTEVTDLSPVPVDDDPLNPADFRIKALSTSLAGNVALLAGLIRWEPVVAENILAGLELTSLRQDRKRFGPAEGVLAGDAARRCLSQRFPPQRAFGATELETYASCPYRFFLEKVLKLEPVQELVLAVDYLERGRLAHEVFATFHRRVNERLGRPASPIELDPESFDHLWREAVEEVLGSAATDDLRAAMREVDRRLLLQWAAEYRQQHQRYDALWRRSEVAMAPEFFEVSFGRAAEGLAPPSSDQPLELFAHDETVRVSGRVDRIDTGQVAGRPVFNVVDYKTGGTVRFNRETVAAGRTLQLPLYAMAVGELLLGDRNAVPWQAGYWYVRGDGFKAKGALRMYTRGDGGLVPEPDWEETRAALDETVVRLVRGMRSGQFPVVNTDEQCTGHCPYKTVCRVNQIRSLRKQWQPTSSSD